MIKVGIIGGGMSGMVAAIVAARNGAKVTILEHKDRLGKKILSTGNGRCNLTNTHMSVDCYRGEDTTIVATMLESYGVNDILSFFKELGVVFKMRGTYVYPRTDQASTILDVLLMELERLQVEIHTETHVTAVQPTKNGFCILTDNQSKSFSVDRVILASGGKAYQALGSDGSGYSLAKSLGHSLAPVVPALVPLYAREKFFSKIAGVRAEAKVTLFIDNQEITSDTGELQLTNYGISGIPVFQVSRYAAMGLYEKREVKVLIDFLPNMTEEDLAENIQQRIEKKAKLPVTDALIGLVHKKLIPVLLDCANISKQSNTGDVSKDQWVNFRKICKEFPVHIKATGSFDQAQICAGGVRTTEVNPKTFESLLVEGLYLTGELLDIDGICGGYNLTFAIGSGFLAGEDCGNKK